MTLLDSIDPRPVHFVGVAGAGMSALAELFARRGVAITGCDANPDGADDLRRLGIAVTKHDPAHAESARALVVTSAMPKDHPELQHAREIGVPIVRRADALGEVTRGRETVAVAGTHGKTTTTGMTAEALAAAGRDPTALVGGRIGAWSGNLRLGGDRLYVVEADEYDRSFLALRPTVAVVTNVEADHLDIYADIADIRRAFAEFVSGARTIVLCGEDEGAAALRLPTGTEVIRYAIHDPTCGHPAVRDARLVARDVSLGAGGSAFRAVWDGDSLGIIRLAVPGRHNVLNALAALGSGLALGAPAEELARGIESFRGVERRFERVGEARGVTVIDDYAHHPTEIAATLAAARGAFPSRRIVVAFQPHLFSRTRDFAADFAAALSADALYLTEIYPSREKPIAGVTSALIADRIPAAGGRLAWRGERRDLARALASNVREGDVVVFMGAGDITESAPELLALLAGAR